MPTAIHHAASHMRNQMRAMDVVAHNLANADTPGFKRMMAHFTGVSDGGARGGGRTSFSELAAERIDFTQGPIQRTGRDLDIAVNGDALLAVETRDGLRLTRKGRMYVDREGILKDSNGHPFAGEAGALHLPPQWRELSVDASGTVSADGQELGRLRLVHIPDKENLRPMGKALFKYDGDRMRPAFEASIVQGAIEQSNVNPVSEIVNLMMRASQSYDAATRILTRVDELQGRVINTGG